MMKFKKILLFFILLNYAHMFFLTEVRSEVKNIKIGKGITVRGFYRVSPEKIQEVERKLDLANKKPINEIALEIFPQKNETLWTLLDIVDSRKQTLERRIAAAQLLGELRLDYNLSVLIDNFFLGYERGKSFKELNSSNFPVGFALIKTSASSVRLNLLNEIKLAHDEEMIRLCAFVLMKIEDKDVARFILEREIRKETTASQKEKLEKALSYLN